MNDQIKKLKRLNKQLTQLLDDPHPGLFTWCNECVLTITEMNDAITRKDDKR